MPAFPCRLTPPRADFLATMSEAESALMGRHRAYLESLGPTAIVFGPVLDPAGVWGLAVLETPGRDELDRLPAQDPLILAQAGYRHDILPMLAAGRGGAASS